MFLLSGFLNRIKVKRLKRSLKHCGNHVYIDPTTLCADPELISIADNCHIQPGCRLFGSGGGIEIKEGTIFSHDIQVFARNHYYDGEDLEMLPYDKRYTAKKVTVGRYVWIGARSTILPGVTKGDGAVIGAASVVTKDIPAGTVAAGNPARVIRYRNLEVYQKLSDGGMGYIKNKTYEK